MFSSNFFSILKRHKMMEFLYQITAQPFLLPSSWPPQTITKTFSKKPWKQCWKMVLFKRHQFFYWYFMGKEGLNLSQVLNFCNKTLPFPLLTFFPKNKRPYKNSILCFISSWAGYWSHTNFTSVNLTKLNRIALDWEQWGTRDQSHHQWVKYN